MAAGVYAENGRVRLALPQQLPRRLREGRAQARPRRRRRHHLRRAQVLDAAVARSGSARRARHSPPATSSARCASRTCRSRPAALGQAPAPAGQMYQLSVRAVGRLPEAPEFDDIILKSRRRRLARPAVSDVGRAELGAETYASQLRFQGSRRGRLRRHPAAVGQRARRRTTRCQAELDAALEAVPARAQVPDRVQHDARSSTNRSARCCKTLVEAIALVVLVIFVFLQTLAQHAHPDDHDPGVARRRVRASSS